MSFSGASSDSDPEVRELFPPGCPSPTPPHTAAFPEASDPQVTLPALPPPWQKQGERFVPEQGLLGGDHPGPFVFSGSSLLCLMWKKLVIPLLHPTSQHWTWEGPRCLGGRMGSVSAQWVTSSRSSGRLEALPRGVALLRAKFSDFSIPPNLVTQHQLLDDYGGA